MPLCIFCSCDLESNNKPEHVLLDAFGGRFQTRDVDCSACNSRFAETIDSAFAAQLIEFRNLHQLTSGSGRPPPKLPKVTIGGRQLCITSDGTPQILGKPFTVTKKPDGTWDLSIQARSEQHIQELIPHIAAQIGISTEDLRKQLASSASVVLLTEPTGTFENYLGLGGSDALRSIVKSGLVLWSTLAGNDDVLSRFYDSARHFVLRGDEKFSLDKTSLDTRDLPNAAMIEAHYGPLFNLLFIRSNEEGRVVGHFTLYNMIGWQFVLAENGGKPGLAIALVSNPELPREWSREAAQECDLPFAWIDGPDRSDLAATKRRIMSTYQHYLRTAHPRAVAKLADKAIQDLGFARDQVLTPAEVETVSSKLIERLSLFLLRMPQQEKFSREKATSLFEQKKRSSIQKRV